MQVFDLFNTDYERRLAEGAVDRLEQRRIDDLNMKMDELAAMAKKARDSGHPESASGLLKKFQELKAERDSYYKLREAGIGQDIVDKKEKIARATPQTRAGAVASTVKNAAKWLAGKGGPGKEGPTYEGADDAWHKEGEWKKVPKAKSGRPVDPRGEVTHLSDVARREAERKADQKKNSEKVNEYISVASDKNFEEAEPYKNYKIYVRKKPFGNTGMYTAHTEIDRKGFMEKAASKEEAVQAIRDRIDFILNAQKKVTGSSTIDFNVKFATDLLADPKQTFYAKLENINGEPKLVIAGDVVANDPELLAAGDFKRSALRNQVDDQGRATPLPGIPLTAKSLRAGEWIANGRYTIGKETTDRDGNRVFDLTYHSTAHTKSDKLRLNQPAFTLGTAREVDEGWSDAIVAQRTGRPRTPYSVFIKGKKWKDFENEDHAEAVANKLRAKFKANGRDPSVITIAATDYDKMEEAGFGEFPPPMKITIDPPKKLKSGETYQDRNKYWQAQGQAPIYKTNEAGSPAQQAAIAIAMKKAGKKPKHIDEISFNQGPFEAGYADGESNKPYKNPHPENSDGYYEFRKGYRAAQKEAEHKKSPVFKSHRIKVIYPEGKGRSHNYTRNEPYKLATIISDANSVARRNPGAEIELSIEDEFVPNYEWQDGVDLPAQGIKEDHGSWIVYDPETKQIKKRFKTHTAGKSYAKTHGLGFASSEYYFDNIKQQVAAEELGAGGMFSTLGEEQVDEKWSKKYKDSINCSNPKGFSQRAHCAGRKKNESETFESTVADQGITESRLLEAAKRIDQLAKAFE